MFLLRSALLLFVGLFGVATAEVFSGQGTWYEVAVAATACGQWYNDGDYIVALQAAFFDAFPGAPADNPNNNPICKNKIKATYQGKSVVAQVADKCGGCPGAHDTDLSPSAFNVLADATAGRIDLTWEWTTLPLGPVSGDSSGTPPSNDPPPSQERRSKILGRRRSLDPVPAQLMRRLSNATEAVVPPPEARDVDVAKRLNRRHLTRSERTEQLERITKERAVNS